MSDENRDDLGDVSFQAEADVAEDLHDGSRQNSMQHMGELLSFPQSREQRLVVIQSQHPKPRPTSEELLAEYERHKAQQQATGHQPDVARIVEGSTLSADVVAGVSPMIAWPTEISGNRATSPRGGQTHIPQLPPPAKPESGKPVCSRCKDVGYVRADVLYGHPDFGKPIKCQCRKELDKARVQQSFLDLSHLGQMKRFEHASFAGFKKRLPGVKEAYTASLDFSRGPSGFLTLVGPNGCGKTHLAIAIARVCLERGITVFFSVVPDLLDHLRASFGANALEQYDRLFQKMKDADLLILDDLGTEQGTPWAGEKLFQLVNYRYNAMLPMVVTANPQAVQTMNPRIASRLADEIVVNIVGATDYRLYNREPKST